MTAIKAVRFEDDEVTAITDALEAAGASDFSDFIRQAAAEKLRRLGTASVSDAATADAAAARAELAAVRRRVAIALGQLGPILDGASTEQIAPGRVKFQEP